MTPLTPAQPQAAPRRPRQARQRPLRYKGVRKRSWGRWVAEIRVPKSRDRLWLGSYLSPHQAARAYDVAAACLRGPAAARNLPSHAVPQPGGRLSLASIRSLAAQEAARFTLHDDHHPVPSEKSSAGATSPASSLLQLGDCSTTVASPAAPPPSPLSFDQYNLQQYIPLQATLPSSTICSSFPDPMELVDHHLCSPLNPIELDHLQLSSAHDSTELDHYPGSLDLHPGRDFMQAAPPFSLPHYAHLHSEGPLQDLSPPEAHHSLQGAAPPSLLDLWFCLDLGPAVDPALKVLLTHSLYPDNQIPTNHRTTNSHDI